MKSPLTAVWLALALAIAVNVFYFSTGSDLTIVVSRTLFADMLLVLTLVPVYESIRIRDKQKPQPFVDRVRAGLIPVAIFTLLIALTTFILFKLFGDPLVGLRLEELTERLDQAIAEGSIDAAQKKNQLELAAQIYSPFSHVLIILLANLTTGFVSAIIAALVIKK